MKFRCLWAISNETVAGIEISFKEKDTKYLEFLFVYYMDDLIREDHDWELLDHFHSESSNGNSIIGFILVKDSANLGLLVLSTSLNHWLEGSHELSLLKHLQVFVTTSLFAESISRQTVSPLAVVEESCNLESDIVSHLESESVHFMLSRADFLTTQRPVDGWKMFLCTRVSDRPGPSKFKQPQHLPTNVHKAQSKSNSAAKAKKQFKYLLSFTLVPLWSTPNSLKNRGNPFSNKNPDCLIILFTTVPHTWLGFPLSHALPSLVPQTHANDILDTFEQCGHSSKTLNPEIRVEVLVPKEAIFVVTAATPCGLGNVII
ncbi:hypothetical protein F8388_006137 [Cannabis sativa]|uniref:Ycf2 N-terminal domain-containing protein n=1 Tax=Cannabis sativa TaxID=3483 RepID=A0A7J6G6R5_CANSA|nr:hypothetical protein F8388_006137 [Cannabis sativa]